MRFKFTIFLLGLNIIVFGLIAYLNQRTGQLDSSMGGLAGQIGRELVEADTIELRGSGIGEPRILRREASSWRISEPMEWRANYFAVNRILNQLQFIEEQAAFSVDEIRKTGQTLADYGLEEPILELIISEGRDSLQLSIGTLTEIGNNVYLLGPDREQIFVVSREVIEGLLVDLSDLRAREIFDIPVFEVQELGLQIKSTASNNNGDLKVRLAKSSGKWRFEAPLSAEADPALVSNAINTLAAVKVGRFVEPENSDPILQGLESPFMRVTLHGNKRWQTLFIGNRDPSSPESQSQYFARFQDNPAVFTVEAQPFEELLKAQEALRERSFVGFQAAQLNTILISEGGLQIRLQKIETGDWQVLRSAGEGDVQPQRADPEVMDALINDLTELRAKSFALDAPTAVDLEQLGFNNPRRTVVLDAGNQEPLTLQLAHPDEENDKLYAKTDDKEFIYEVERRPTLRLVPLNELHYRNRVLEKLPQGASVRRIKLTHLLTEETLFEHTLDGFESWQAKLETIDTESAAAIEVLLGTIRNFGVNTYLGDEYGDTFKVDSEKELPWSFSLEADILLPGGEEEQIREYVYTFTERLSGTVQIGGSQRHSATFELAQDFIEALYHFTETMELSPEAADEPVPTPSPIEPVPEPTPPPAT